uniref:PQ loop repeat protein n=1 Tax=viral metagenome TaxID=1070528 RepID=A0A6C0IV85_9ZZZZ
METSEIVGYIAAFFLVITLLPQVYFTYKLKNADSISLYFLFLQIVTCILFLSYGILLKESPLIVANSLVLTQSFTLLGLKLLYSKSNRIGVEGSV